MGPFGNTLQRGFTFTPQTVVGYDHSQITVQYKESDKNQPESSSQILSRGSAPA